MGRKERKKLFLTPEIDFLCACFGEKCVVSSRFVAAVDKGGGGGGWGERARACEGTVELGRDMHRQTESRT